MASATDKGTASLSPDWKDLPLSSLKDLRTVLSFRMMHHLRINKMKEAENCRNLVSQVRARINELEAVPS